MRVCVVCYLRAFVVACWVWWDCWAFLVLSFGVWALVLNVGRGLGFGGLWVSASFEVLWVWYNIVGCRILGVGCLGLLEFSGFEGGLGLVADTGLELMLRCGRGVSGYLRDLGLLGVDII